ncbi:MAG TPA: hypothetical protein VF543_19320 [Pyrinomonadaceae bacterium]|jgi:hypothetical protein
MKNILVFSLLFILLGMSALVSSAQNKDTAVITGFISKQATQESGTEYESARKVVKGDLNRDGVADLAVLYKIEGQNGSNNYVQYLAVFTRNKDGLVPVTYTVVGGKSNRSVELTSIRNNVISFKTLNYGPKDAACCPSKKGATRFVLVNSKLKEL